MTSSGGWRPSTATAARSALAERLATVPATLASGVRTALDYLAHPSRGALAVAGAIGFWAANIGVLWASFEAFGGDVPSRCWCRGSSWGWPPT